MTQKERIEELEREIELLKAQVAELLARPQYVPVPAPYRPWPRPYHPWRWGSGTTSAPPNTWGQIFNVNDGGI